MSWLSRKSLYSALFALATSLTSGQAAAISLSDTGESFVPYDKSYALVMGVGKYREYTKIAEAVGDAKAMATILQEKFDFDVELLTDDEVTRESVLTWLVDVKLKAGPNDRIIVYFAGHGVREQGAVGRALGYLLPAKTKKGGHVIGGIRMSEIADHLNQAAAKHTMFIPDACYSGIAAQRVATRAASTSHDMSATHLHKRVAQEVHVTMSGGASDEQVVNEYLGHGLFTGRLIAALTGQADLTDDGWITHDELKTYLVHEVSVIAKREWGRVQNPVIDPHGEGLFVFRNPTHTRSASGEKTRFFRKVDWNKGELVGVGPLTPDQQSHRELSYRVDHGEDSMKVSRVNGRGTLVVGEENTAVWEHFMGRSGISEIEQKDEREHLQRIRVYPRGSRARMVQFNSADGGPLKEYANQDRGASDSVYGEYFTYDKDGYVERKRFQSLSRVEDPRPKNGSWGVRYERHPELHLPVRSFYLGPEGSDGANSQGVAFEEQAYDAAGNLISSTTKNSNGEPIAVNGVARWEGKVDDWGNHIEVQLFDAAGARVLGESGFAIVRYAYSKRGEKTQRRYFDAEDKPSLNEDGVHEVRITPGSLGHAASQAYFGTDGRPILSKEGYHRVKFTRIERAGWVLREDYLGIDGKPILSRDGYARVVRKPDERGNVVREAYFDTRGKPTLNQDHVASWEQTFNANDEPVSVAYFNTRNEPTNHADYYSGWTRTYDERTGHLLSSTYSNREGQPTLTRDGYSQRKYEHDQQGRLIRFYSLFIKDKFNRGTSDPIDMRFRYDDATDQTSEVSAIWSPDDPWSTMEYQYDDNGRVRVNRYFSDGKEPFDRSTPEGTITYEYDGYGLQTKRTRSGADGEIWWSEIKEYDARRQLVFEAEFYPDGEQKYSAKRKGFDGLGRLVEETLVIPARYGSPDPNDPVRWTQTFDARGNLLERRSLNKEGIAIADIWEIEHYGCTVVRWSEYDDRGRIGKVACLDAQGTVLMEASRGSGKGAGPVELRLKAPPLPWLAELESADAERFDFEARRAAMVKEQLGRAKEDYPGMPLIEMDPRVISAMGKIPMEIFVQPRFWEMPKERYERRAYWDRPIPVGHDETLSQPFIMAQQLSGLKVTPGDKILELKTASGYQAAVLEKMGATVYTVETDLELASRIRSMLSYLGTRKIHLGLAPDCYQGWPEKGPFDGIIATAAYPAIPRELVDQLKVGGRLVAPIGVMPDQWLTVYEKQEDGTLKQVEEPSPVMYTMIPRP